MSDGTTEFEFIIIDQNNPNCFKETGLDPINYNSNCKIWDFECNNDGTYNLNINFNYANINNDSFDVFANGELFGYYAFANLLINLENFPANRNTFDAIKVCQNDLPTYCETLEFAVPD